MYRNKIITKDHNQYAKSERKVSKLVVLKKFMVSDLTHHNILWKKKLGNRNYENTIAFQF